ncbi:MAG TPA: class I SAM-dependent methyltransferase, partial [Pirellulaceae bacterium]
FVVLVTGASAGLLASRINGRDNGGLGGIGMAVADSMTRNLSATETRDSRSLWNLPQPPSRFVPIPLVKLCYTLVHAAEAAGIRDLADGEYLPSDTCLEQGIERQLNHLLDQVGCDRPGFRLLEIGCGYGHLLRLAQARGAEAVGVNVSHEQVTYCNNHGSKVFCCTYRDLLEAKEWHGRFDGVIANGSLEHWVQPEDVQAGRMDAIYRESFEIAHRMLDPLVQDSRYVTTAIHVKRDVKPEYLLTAWYRHPKGSDQRHFSLLHNWMGGYYPVDGQLASCARPYFALEEETDGTIGYKIANDFRLMRMMRGLYTNPKLVWRIARALACHPRVTSTMIMSYFVEQSWDWQFRGADPPMKLLRQTWRRNPLVK